MQELTNISELTEMIRVSISDNETCEEDLESLDLDFQQRILKNTNYDELSNKDKEMLANIKDDMLFFRKRAFIKTIISNIDGILYATKQIILESKDKITNDKDIINLQEIRYEGSAKSKLKEIPVYPNFIENLKLVFRYYKTLYSPNYNLEKFYSGLEQYKIVKEIRNKIIHPKNTANLNVSDEELEKCKEFYSWFYTEYRKLLENDSKDDILSYLYLLRNDYHEINEFINELKNYVPFALDVRESGSIQNALNIAVIIPYSRNFKYSRGFKSVYKINDELIKGFTEDEKRLHKIIVDDRDQEYAHSDALLNDIQIYEDNPFSYSRRVTRQLLDKGQLEVLKIMVNKIRDEIEFQIKLITKTTI
jgi:hypothetical protein